MVPFIPCYSFGNGAASVLNAQSCWIIDGNSAQTWNVTSFPTDSLHSSVVFHAYQNETFQSTVPPQTEDKFVITDDSSHSRSKP